MMFVNQYHVIEDEAVIMLCDTCASKQFDVEYFQHGDSNAICSGCGAAQRSEDRDGTTTILFNGRTFTATPLDILDLHLGKKIVIDSVEIGFGWSIAR